MSLDSIYCKQAVVVIIIIIKLFSFFLSSSTFLLLQHSFGTGIPWSHGIPIQNSDNIFSLRRRSHALFEHRSFLAILASLAFHVLRKIIIIWNTLVSNLSEEPSQRLDNIIVHTIFIMCHIRRQMHRCHGFTFHEKL